MTSQDSDSELTGKVAASLTPPVTRVHVPRGEQSSGFFDLDALYTMHVQHTRRAVPPPLPLPAILPVRPVARPLPPALPRETLASWPATRARPQPIGWYAVFVTWLATMTLATLSATQLPAHVATHARALTPLLPPALTLPPTPAPTLASASASAPTLAPSPALPSAPPSFAIADLPRVLPHVRSAPARPATRHARSVAAPPEPPSSPSPPPPPAPAPASASAPIPALAPSPRATSAASLSSPPASTADTSLEDLIRHEVAAEQKRLHPPPKP
ncbi:MAG TPA: hypothetical protein VGL81_02250 [Polyangiaceae bacterium]